MWIRSLTDPVNAHVIILAEITRVEVAAALAARHRATGGISRAERDAAVALLARHCQVEYRLISIVPRILDQAVNLTQNHRLRGYDAVQLAAALAANTSLLAVGLPGLIFAAADNDLVAAARLEGLASDNPNHHP